MAPAPAGVGCLQGKVFGLTGELPRKLLEASIKSQGATVSAIIHKRVSFVLCTADAVKYSTQKVRKALKHGIPLVSQDFMAACALASRVVDHAPFLQAPRPESQASPSYGAKLLKPNALEACRDAPPFGPGGGGGGGGGAPNPAGNNASADNICAAEELPGDGPKKKRRRLEESEPARRPAEGKGGAEGEDSVGGSGLRSGGSGDRGDSGGDNGGGADGTNKTEGGGGEKGKKGMGEYVEIEAQEVKKRKKGRKKKKEQKGSEENMEKKERKARKEKKEKKGHKKVEQKGEKEESEKKEKKRDKKTKRRKVAESQNDCE